MVRLAAEAAQQRLAAEAAQQRWEAEAAQQRSGLGDGGGRPLIITTKELTGVSFGDDNDASLAETPRPWSRESERGQAPPARPSLLHRSPTRTGGPQPAP